MAIGNLVVDIKIAWWFTYLYLPLMDLFCVTFGTEPDVDKVTNVLSKAIKIGKPKVVNNGLT